MTTYDIIVIGAGASGLMAAINAADNNRVLIVEANNKIGKKLLATGNGRCNLSNLNISTKHYNGNAYKNSLYSEESLLIEGLLNEYDSNKIIDIFASFGINTIADAQGRVYPQNEQAAAVVKIFSDVCTEKGVDCITDFNVFSVVKSGEYFYLKSDNKDELRSKKLIICTGSKAASKLLSSDENYNIAKQLGHTVTPLYPTLTGFTSDEKFLKSLSGTRAKCRVSLNGISSEGEVIFSDKSISGICIFDLSVYAVGKDLKNSILSLDLLKNMSESQVNSYIVKLIHNRQNMLCGELLNGILNLKMASLILKQCKIDSLLPCNKLKMTDIEKIAKKVKNFEIKINGTKDFADAQVVAGGIPLSEIHVLSMESKICPKLYFAGEILNIHGDCGGYNLHWAWISGIVAGKSASNNTIYQ